MRDGDYAICLSADGYEGAGTLRFDGKQGRGHDNIYSIALQVSEVGSRGAGHVDVHMDQEAVNAKLPPQFSLPVTGTIGEADFFLIGVGPLGVIITITGELKTNAAKK